MMKRGREDGNGSSIEDSSTSLELVANCLVQISNGPFWGLKETSIRSKEAERMFECKTCGRAFNSFQALGGHRASHHKKPKVLLSSDEEKMKVSEAALVKVKAKTVHECSICGLKFPLGQALGGHMRRHRVDQPKGEVVDHHHAKVLSRDDDHNNVAKLVPVLMRSLSKNRRVMCMDLNLTPLENDLQLLFGKKAPKVDCKLVL